MYNIQNSLVSKNIAFRSRTVKLTDSRMLNGIKLFNGLSIQDVDFIRTNLETINLYRGCTVNCSHCLKNAINPIKENATILFEDLVEFVNGFKSLNERAGDNVLTNTKYLNIVDDSNPSDIPINGLNGKHSVVEAMKLIYEKLNIPTLFVTSGWNPLNKYAQESSEKIVNMIQNNPDSVKNVEISLNPFSHIMDVARASLKKGDVEKYNFFKNIYTDRIANTLATFSELFNSNKAQIIYRHAKDGNDGTDNRAMKALYQEIYNKLKLILGSKIETIPNLGVDKVTNFDKSHLIEASGRGRQFFGQEHNFGEQQELIKESIYWDRFSPEDKMAKLKHNSLKCIDINGNVYATFPAVNVRNENIPIELTVQTPIRLNYLNNKDTNPVFSDIDICLTA